MPRADGGRAQAALTVELPQSREGLRRPDDASAHPCRGIAPAAPREGIGVPRADAGDRQGRHGGVVSYGDVDTRARLGISVLPLDLAGLRKVTQALRDNEMVITAIDRDITGTGRTMPFFGKPAPIPMGPAAMAIRMGTPLFPVCVYRLPDDSYMVEGSPLVVADPAADEKAEEHRITLELVRNIEGFIRAHPDQWHVPHRIWDGGP
ncbi:MAG: lysophospholipid acyltransferase family protein [Chloroflexi bacterium]|nr:MAG: lysophospholipid acyltransferase family protein [Chloroflexota bacterium]